VVKWLSDSERAPINVTWLSMAANLLLIVVKFVIGTIAGSAALVADAVHSSSDFISDALVLVGLRLARNPSDEEHPYGHGKVETSVTLAVGVLLLTSAGYLFAQGVAGLGEDHRMRLGAAALAAAALSIVVKEGLYQLTVRIGRRLRLSSLLANAWHHRSDALSSVAALVGIGGSLLGMGQLDHIAAMLVAVLVAHAGLTISWQAYRDLIDTAVDAGRREAVAHCIESVPGVKSWHKLRTRRGGSAVFVDVHVVVDEALSVRAAHDISEQVRLCLINDELADDVTVHIDVRHDDD
jgi:cation diffusion facilitator family transporter